ncbi:cache domain-containing protein [Azospirillum halopraeferens]|uniref:cache domain-containing protein n=1 Tax=Azospirillum halopraeferens TaxID=34010 RepID=UPI00048FE1FD|nr:cache domain-containing protein [Azospirillum halopraeferens]
MVRSRLFLRLFSGVLLGVVLFSGSYYLLSVPLVKESVYRIELDASRTILDNVHEMVARLRAGLDEQRAYVIDTFRAEMRTKVALAAGYIDYVFDRADRGEISRDEAERLIYDGLKAFRYGKDDYIWLTNYDAVLLSHPDPDWTGRSAAEVQDPRGGLIVPDMIARARNEGEGYHVYPWRRPGGDPPVRKMSYFRHLPRHGLVIGAGAYMDDIDTVVENRLNAAVEELRQAVLGIRIARTGYVYIFDSSSRMIIHPNTNIDRTAFGNLRDPATGALIGEALKGAAHDGRTLRYLWDKPSDPGNYVYEKISWVRHVEGLDWYIASSVYEEELRSSSVALGNRLFAVSLGVMVLGGGMGYLGAHRLTRPLRRLADTAAQVRAGNLDARSGIRRNDEIGDLAATFDGMVQRVKDDIATLDSRVRERTAALEEAEARQRLILDAIPAAIAYLDGNERLRFVNRRWADQPHARAGRVLGRRLRDAVDADAYRHLAPLLDRARAGESAGADYAATDGHGRAVITRFTLIPHLDARGATVGFFVLAPDVTAEVERRRHLDEAERLKAVGQLAGGLAHDFNNLLTIILGNLAVARERFAGHGDLDAHLEPAQRASRRGADITARLLAFSRRQPLKPQPVEVCGLVRELAVLLSRSLPAGIAIVTPGPQETARAMADPTQLENALVNLALNARDAMPEGGTLTITAGPLDGTAAEGFDEPPAPGRRIAIRVRDTGCGFAAGAAERAFEPFYTTKALGSGLGLSMVYGFVKQSGGFIAIDSAPGAGTTVTLLLPEAGPADEAVAPAAAAPAEPAPGDALAGGWRGKLALVVEDDADVRLVMRRQLIDLGLSVIEAQSGDEAMELVEHLDDLSLVVSDVVMPGVTGPALARHLRATRPEVKVVLVSGFATEVPDEGEGLVILRKPWEKSELAGAIHSCTTG